ncbi:hypothetical protein [Phenylobacterium sp.]|uniref:hypothetical protein n=1 Tax=Phenylobacterium sp. TaxID=1871053 RepID=UPI0025F5D10C|nr:hypothetical protein [Phenylobacterium sp.]
MQLTRSMRASLNGTAALRAKMLRTGKTPAGKWLWSEEEINLLRALHPDYRALEGALPRRTLKAMQQKAAKLGIARRVIVWRGNEVARLRRPYVNGAPVPDIGAALSGKTAPQVYAKAARKQYRRPRRRPKRVEWPLVDSVRQRAFEMNIPLCELDRETGGGRYFSRPTRLDLDRIELALPILGGAFKLRWSA